MRLGTLFVDVLASRQASIQSFSPVIHWMGSFISEVCPLYFMNMQFVTEGHL